MRRREFIAVLGGIAFPWPLGADAQQSSMPVIGFLHSSSADAHSQFVSALLEGLKQTGYVEGKDVAIEYRWAEDQYSRLPALAAELVRHPVAVMIAGGSSPCLIAAKASTAMIPIVVVAGTDPVQLGLVASLGRPGGNITGVSILASSLEEKRFGLLHELILPTKEIAVLVNPANAVSQTQIREVQDAARSVMRRIRILQATSESDLDQAFASLTARQSGALLVAADASFTAKRDRLIALAARHSVPAMYFWKDFAVAGGLMSYSKSLRESYRQVGIYAGRILKGEKPADLPVQQPTKFELVINLKTAKALDLIIPPALLARADEVIE